MTWKTAIALAITYNVAMTIGTWAFLFHFGYTTTPLSVLPVGFVALGITPLQTALYKLGKR